jgi:hypothetical protein
MPKYPNLRRFLLMGVPAMAVLGVLFVTVGDSSWFQTSIFWVVGICGGTFVSWLVDKLIRT